MRVITGKYKGRHFDIPRTFKARPTTDFAKENIFNVLNGYIDFEDCRALDLFAGTGVVADYFNKKYDVVLNDLLRCNYISYECFFSDLEYSEKKVTDIIEKYNKKNVCK